LFGLIAVVAHLGEEREFLDVARASDPRWLVVAAALQIATYACAGLAWQRGLRRFGIVQSLRGLFGLGLAKLFTDQAMPSAGVSGTILVVRTLVHRGVATGAAVAAVLAAVIGYYAAYAVSIVATLTILWLAGGLSRLWLGLATALWRGPRACRWRRLRSRPWRKRRPKCFAIERCCSRRRRYS
jgi:hypothetical protein